MAHGMGRMVRWDASARVGALVVEGLPAEVRVDEEAVDSPGDRDLEPGELVEVQYERDRAGAGYRAVRVCPTDAEA